MYSTGIAPAPATTLAWACRTALVVLPSAREWIGCIEGGPSPRRSTGGIMEPADKTDRLASDRGAATRNPRAVSPLVLAASNGATTRPTVREMLARYTDKT
jgi:hypothetical protein